MRRELELLFVDQSMQWAVPFALQIKKVPYRIAPLEQSADRAHAAVGVGVGVSFPSHATLSAAQVWHIVPEKSNNQILGISPYPFPAGGHPLDEMFALVSNKCISRLQSDLELE